MPFVLVNGIVHKHYYLIEYYMHKTRILYIAQELEPYTDISKLGTFLRNFILSAKGKSFEMRILMPKFGTINERRHRLHEVVRLSGMNIIIDDDDFPLIIKVASLPDSRIQVYFLDNEEFFKRKNVFKDDNGDYFEDNDSRMIFFCKGAMETVKKFGWPPDIIHANGWMTSLIPLFVRKVYNNDPVYQHSKVIYTPASSIDIEISEKFKEKVLINDMEIQDIDDYVDSDGKVNLDLGAIKNSDGIIFCEENILEEDLEKIDKDNSNYYIHKSEDESFSDALDFYKSFMK